MEIEKAIERLRDIAETEEIGWHPDDHKAIQLGIEALQRELDNRSGSKYVIVAPLKGETKD